MQEIEKIKSKEGLPNMSSYFSEPDFTKISEEDLKRSLNFPTISDEQKGVIVNELVRRNLSSLNETIKASGKQEEKFSVAFIALGAVQIFIALWQFIFEVQTTKEWLTGSIAFTTLFGIITFVVYKFRIGLKEK